MKTIAQLIRNTLLMSLLLTTSDLRAQVTSISQDDSVKKQTSFEVGMFIEARGKLNLMLATHQPKRVSITLRDANKTVLYIIHLKKTPLTYRQKFDFEGSPSGIYQLEISDGQQTLIRQVEVVDMPAIDAQRYITYGLRTPVE